MIDLFNHAHPPTILRVKVTPKAKAAALGVPKSSIVITHGLTSRNKVIQINR